ncbi:hypothetical protein WJX74_000772 [Apatococcus lobatus]|uniref:Ribosomal RNA-processing protein 8 n=1 Tax=Apatococcus lobatus TaxID=904363 RepID=A0AAW1SA78_9CHLO
MDLLDVPAWDSQTPDPEYPTLQLPPRKPHGSAGTAVDMPTAQTATKSRRARTPAKHSDASGPDYAAAGSIIEPDAAMQQSLHPKVTCTVIAPVDSMASHPPAANREPKQQQPDSESLKQGKRKHMLVANAPSGPQTAQAASASHTASVQSRPGRQKQVKHPKLLDIPQAFSGPEPLHLTSEPQNRPMQSRPSGLVQQHQQQQPLSKQRRAKQKQLDPANAPLRPQNRPSDPALNTGSMQDSHAADEMHAHMAAGSPVQQRQPLKRQKVRVQQKPPVAEGLPRSVTSSPVPSSSSLGQAHAPVLGTMIQASRKQAKPQAGHAQPGTVSPPLHDGLHEMPFTARDSARPDLSQQGKASASSRKLARLGMLETRIMASPASVTGHAQAAAHLAAGMLSMQAPRTKHSTRDQEVIIPKQPQQSAPEGTSHDDHSSPEPSRPKRGKTSSKESGPKPDAVAGLQQDDAHPLKSGKQHDKKILNRQKVEKSQPHMNPAAQAKHSSSRQTAMKNAEDNDAAHSALHQGAQRTKGKKKQGSGLLDQMRAKLSGSHFRWLNEHLYTTTGDAALDFMTSNPSHFDEYHKGFRQQTAQWPARPLDAIITRLQQLPASFKVADFGCGDAELAATVAQPVFSFDLVANAPGVIACNMAHVPLDNGSMDVAVFCLALMGTDYPSFLREAHRVLRPGGTLWIAEVSSRFQQHLAQGSETSKHSSPARLFVRALESSGFRLRSTDDSNKMFVAWELLKVERPVPFAKPDAWPALKACSYKKR